jgi:hypothetical protein
VSLMFGELFHKSPLIFYPLLALIVFIAVFAAAALRAWCQRPELRDELARLPLRDEQEDVHE